MSARSTPPLPSVPRGLMAIAGLAALAVAFTYAFHVVFSRPLSQDEGYLMITLQSFIEGHALYDSVFTQYGPFYYFYEWILRTLLAVPLTHDATRWLCIFHWLTASAILGLAAKVITRSVLAGAFVFMQAVVHLTAIANEPGHPQELVVVLLALGILVAARAANPAESRTGFQPVSPLKERAGAWDLQSLGRLGLLAAITALLAFTKINVGIFFGLSLLLAMRCQSKDRFSGPAWTWLLAGVGAVLPLLLMRGHLSAEWCRNYSLIAVCAVTAAYVLAQSSSEKRALGMATHFRIAACFLIPSALLLGLVAWTGTSPQGLLDGLFLTPLKMPGVALLPLPLSNAALVNAAVSLALALAVRLKPRDSRLAAAVLVLKALFGIAGTCLFIGNVPAQFAWLLPWVWLVLIPARPERARALDAPLVRSPGFSPPDIAGQPKAWTPYEASHETFPRIFLALAAAWQGLQAYPIAGTQVTTATFLLTLAFTLCLHDALVDSQQWNPIRSMRERLAQLAPARLRLAQVLGVVALLYVFANLWCRLGDVRRDYVSLPALGLPGSRFVHMDAATAGVFRELTAYLEKECDTFVTYPGINSLYFWTGKRPPTHLNSTGWGQLSHAQQEQILTGLRQSRRPLLVVVAAAAQSWSQGAPAPILPLVRCVTEDSREVKRIGQFILFVPKRTGETAQRE